MTEKLQQLIDLHQQIPQPLRLTFIGIGAVQILKSVWGLSQYLYKNYIRRPFDLEKRYGNGTWALVTGAGAGIGLEFCHYLAEHNFNIVLVGRSDSVQQAADSLRQKYRVQIKVIQVDLKNYNQSVAQIAQEVKNLDISILLNNAGVLTVGEFISVPLSKIQEIIDINCVAPITLTRALLPQLLERKQKSAVIFISSFAGVYNIPYMSTYSGSKAFIRGLSLALAEEYRGKLDFLTATPAAVATRMSTKASYASVSPQAFVEGTMRSLGKDDETFGAAKHRNLFTFQNWFYGKDGVSNWLARRYKRILGPNVLQQ